MCLNPALAPGAEKKITMMEFLDQLWSFNLDRATVFGLFEQSFVFVIGMTAILASLGVILCASPFYSALYLIGNMMCLALLFLLYHAEFLAAVQVIVYAGAILIFYLFVVMLLDLPGEEARPRYGMHWPFAAAAGLSFVGLAWLAQLDGASLATAQKPAVEGGATLGSVAEVGRLLFGPFALPFELASLVLLAAIVGAVVLARRRSEGS